MKLIHRGWRATTSARLVCEVLDDAARERLVDNIVGHLKGGVSEKVLARAIKYCRQVDKNLGHRIAEGVRK